jgi:hypothetical protein
MSVVVAILVVALAEVGLRIAAPHIPEPLTWDNWQTQNKSEAMQRLSADGGASVVSVGSSMVISGFDPDLFTRLLRRIDPTERRPAFNAALAGSNIHLTELWTLDVVVPRLRPKIVVIGMNSAEFNRNGVELFENLFVDSPAWRKVSGDGSAFQKIKDDFSDWSYLVRYRQVLRNPTGFFRVSLDRVRGEVSRTGVTADIKRFQSAPYGIRPSLRKLAADIFHDYEVGPARVEALGRLVDTLNAKGITVVLVRMPITKDEIPFHPHGAADYAEFERIFDAFVAQHPDAHYLNAMPFFPSTEWFRDPHHLNLKGKEKLTRLIAEFVAKL